MHQIHELLSPAAVIGDRYVVIDLIGTGGFSAVYLVQDQQQEDSFFALKEVLITNQEARERFTFECTLLERLVHPALPRVHHVFSNEAQNRSYMLMDYVEGPNLETLRHIQAEKRFSLPVITAILAPIADAIAYLHQQDPPIIHRDIKPANIIVPVAGGKAILVDFGIAKAYDTQGTTSAERHGSPGYGAPEQYSAGTNTRTDIYGLGATLYSLLTGVVPPDALDRMTKLSNENPDSLRPASELVPSIPRHASVAIQRAMAIKMVQRFATVQEFWQALQGESGPQLRHTEALNSIGVPPAPPAVSGKTAEPSSQTTQARPSPGRRTRKRPLLPVLFALVVIGAMGAGLWSFTEIGRNHTATPTPITHPTAVATAPVTSGPYPRLVASYHGMIDDLRENVPSPMTLTRMRQNGRRFSGSFSALHQTGPYSGSLGTSNSIDFIVAGSGGRAPLHFWGSVGADGSLGGTFCASDQKGNCLPYGAFGWWQVASR
jgi:serine/threonine protein kinase